MELPLQDPITEECIVLLGLLNITSPYCIGESQKQDVWQNTISVRSLTNLISLLIGH